MKGYLGGRYRERKDRLDAIKLERGCASCGYNRCVAALTFHHRDPAEKAFKIGSGQISSRSWEKIEAEVEKCDVLCANCHAELHAAERLEAVGV
jgi:hypothetical protein